MKKNDERVKQIISEMTLEEKVGQLFLLAFPGKDAAKIEPLIDKYQICGCYISQDNAETFAEAKALTDRIQQRALAKNKDLPLLLGVDQEGAWGVLVPESKPGPGNLALGAADDVDLTYKMYGVCASEMQSVGYNTILGPCSDINLNPQNPIIGTRSFGEEPRRVAMHVAAAIKGLNDYGVLSAAKHFPGHGDTSGDSHREIPVVDKPLAELLENDLLPFQAAVDAGVDLIMTSHIRFPQIDKEYPATLSKKILVDLLREQMKFEGVIITDSMNMGGIRRYYSPEESILMALKAGSDLLMLSEEHYDHSEDYLEKQLASIEAVISAVKSGNIPLELIEDRLYRIINLKINKMNLLHERDSLSSKEGEDIVREAARNAITLVENSSKLIPLDVDKKYTIINATPRSSYAKLMNPRGIGPNQKLSAFDTFKEEIAKHLKEVKFLKSEDLTGEADFEKLTDDSTVIVVTEDYPLPGEDFEKTEQQKLVNKLISIYKNNLIIVGLRSPYEVMNYRGVECYISAISSRTCSAKAMSEALMGKFELSGRLPVTIN
jgi:beta-N-acetylhexosaminidase